MRVGIFIKNYGTGEKELGDLTLNNPGMGGSQYEMFLFAQLFSNTKNLPFETTLFLTNDQKFKEPINYIKVKDIDEVFEYANEHKFDYLLLRTNDGIHILDKLNGPKVIYWAHNFINYESANIIAKNNNVKKLVFVSHEEYDYYYDHDVIYKSDFIFNAIPSTANLYKENIQIQERSISFIGDLAPFKMFDRLTKIWPKILKKVPDAKLYVFGNGNLYGKDITFGKRHIAEEEFENKFMKPLEKNHVENSVIFNGIVKNGLRESVSKTRALVLMNPKETFCIAATDAISTGTPVIAPKSTGYCDVVSNKKTGYLFKTNREAIKRIVEILKQDDYGKINKKELDYLNLFSPESFKQNWISFFENIDIKKNPKHKNNLLVDNKIFVVLQNKIRNIFHLPNCFSRIGIKSKIAKLLRKN